MRHFNGGSRWPRGLCPIHILTVCLPQFVKQLTRLKSAGIQGSDLSNMAELSSCHPSPCTRPFASSDRSEHRPLMRSVYLPLRSFMTSCKWSTPLMSADSRLPDVVVPHRINHRPAFSAYFRSAERAADDQDQRQTE